MARKRRKSRNRRKHAGRRKMYNRGHRKGSRRKMYNKGKKGGRKGKRKVGKYAAFAKAMWRKHKAAYKRLGFRKAGKAIGAAWRKHKK